MSALFAGVLALGGAGCLRIPTHIEKGEDFATGNPKYDDYFKAVRELRADALKANDDEVAARQDLAHGLHLDPKTEATSLASEAHVSAKKFRDYGVMMHLELTPNVKVSTVRGIGATAEKPDEFVKAVEGSTRASLDLTRRLIELTRRAGDLERKRVALQTDAANAFRGLTQVKRDEINHELDASADVLKDATETAKTHAGRASQFVVELTQAMETGAAVAAATPAIAPGTGKAPAGAAAKAPAAAPAKKPAYTKPAAAAAPAPKKPKASDDFEP